MRRVFSSRFTILFLTAFTLLSFAFSGCLPTCTVPAAHFSSIRAVNAVTNTDALIIKIDGKVFDRAYYDLLKYGGRRSFGYQTTFLADGSSLQPGTHHIEVFRDDETTRIFDTALTLTDERQTLLYIGRYGGTARQKPRELYLRDQVHAADAVHTYARFVHGVSDLDTLDTYFSKYAKVSATGALAPDLRFGYGKISDKNGGDAGTGLSVDDYLIIPAIADGLMVTKKADTTAAGTILTIPYWLSSFHLLATIVIRGESKPIGTEATVSEIVLQDGQEGYGSYSINYDSYGIRFVNGTRFPKMSLLADGTLDIGKPPRSNIPQQAIVLGVPTDSITDYWPLTITYFGTGNFYFSPSGTGNDNIDTFNHVASPNGRYTFVAIDTMPQGSSVPDGSAIILSDTMTVPSDPTMGRIRFVDASPDHHLDFTFAGKPYSMKRGDVKIADAPQGPYTVQVTDGSVNIGSFSIDATQWSHGYPITVFFMAATGTTPLPYGVAYK